MNWLLPAPKSIEKLGGSFVPLRWRTIKFPQEVETGVQDILQVMGDKWKYRPIEQKIESDDKKFGEGYWFWLGDEEKTTQVFFSLKEDDRRMIIDKTEAYLLNIQEDGVLAWSASLIGLHYALQTLRQILNGKELFELSIVDWPDLLWRGVHVDAKGERPRFAKLIRTLKEWSHFKVNMVLFEYEDAFPYSHRPEIVGPLAYSTWEVQEIQHQARNHFITIVPLVQSIGHVEYILRNPDYAFLRENGEIAQFCSSRDEVFRVIGDLIHEVAEAHPDSPWIHIGGDEAWYLGGCVDCANKMEKIGMGRLYIDHMNRVIQLVKKAGKRPIMWDDVLRRLDNREEIKRLDQSCIIHYWDYQTCGSSLNSDWILFLQSHGFQVLGGSAMRGASGMDSYCPEFGQRYRNSKNWGYTADRFSMPGVIATSWGRYGTLKPLIEPFDLGWYGAIAAAEHFWNAKGMMDKQEFDQGYAEVFLGDLYGEFPKSMKRFEKGLPYQLDWLERKTPRENHPSENFLSLLDVMWKWKSEEQAISRKLELLEARLYRVVEEQFPDWERWRMVDRAQELQDQLWNVLEELRQALLKIMEAVWLEEYILAFGQKYLFRIDNVLKALMPLTPRPARALVKIGADYG